MRAIISELTVSIDPFLSNYKPTQLSLVTEHDHTHYIHSRKVNRLERSVRCLLKNKLFVTFRPLSYIYWTIVLSEAINYLVPVSSERNESSVSWWKIDNINSPWSWNWFAWRLLVHFSSQQSKLILTSHFRK